MKLKALKDIILYEDKDFIVVNKPPFISSLEDRNDKNNLHLLAKSYHSDAQMAHRLDKETSGALIIAKNPEAYRHISMQFTAREVEKVYHAVVEGAHKLENKEVRVPIEIASSKNKVRLSQKGKDATTIFNTLKSYQGYTMVSARPITGRMHQIRIHLVSLGTTIVGDRTYGGKPFFLSSVKRKFNLKKGSYEEPLMQRLALHAFRVKFMGTDSSEIAVEAPYPKDFNVLIKQLEKYG